MDMEMDEIDVPVLLRNLVAKGGGGGPEKQLSPDSQLELLILASRDNSTCQALIQPFLQFAFPRG